MGSCPDTDIDPNFLSHLGSSLLLLKKLNCFYYGLYVHFGNSWLHFYKISQLNRNAVQMYILKTVKTNDTIFPIKKRSFYTKLVCHNGIMAG